MDGIKTETDWGLVVSLVIMLLFTLLGTGIGVINPATEENPLGGVGTGAAIWMGITALIALFLEDDYLQARRNRAGLEWGLAPYRDVGNGYNRLFY